MRRRILVRSSVWSIRTEEQGRGHRPPGNIDACLDCADGRAALESTGFSTPRSTNRARASGLRTGQALRLGRELSSRIGHRQRRACRSAPPEFLTLSATPARSGSSCRWCPRHPEGTSPGSRRRRTALGTFHGAAWPLRVGLGIRSKGSRWGVHALAVLRGAHCVTSSLASLPGPSSVWAIVRVEAISSGPSFPAPECRPGTLWSYDRTRCTACPGSRHTSRAHGHRPWLPCSRRTWRLGRAFPSPSGFHGLLGAGSPLFGGHILCPRSSTSPPQLGQIGSDGLRRRQSGARAPVGALVGTYLPARLLAHESSDRVTRGGSLTVAVMDLL